MSVILRLIIMACLFAAAPAMAQPSVIERVEPGFWWVGMNNPEVQLLVYGEDIGNTRAVVDYQGVQVTRLTKVENPNYLFVTLNISDQAQPGTFDIIFSGEGATLEYEYELHPRQTNSTRNQGFDASDVIYLIMPDRFANGDPDNDEIEGMLEGVDRSNLRARHGGDIQGIIQNLDYIQELGMTAIWLNPILENDMPPEYGAYHGYAATDKYRVDRRFGTNEEFLELVDQTHSRGMKVIMDMIHNHIGLEHWLMKDLPASDWFHDRDEYGITNYRTTTIMDPYASEFDFNATVKGWFVKDMPDLDQRNDLVATYLIQNTIWWIEYAGIDGIRMDTHPYPYKEYMAEWARVVLEEYPDFNIVGEAWMPNVPTTAYWQYNFPSPDGYESHLPSVTDFPLYMATVAGLNEPEGWDSGLNKIFQTLGQDFLYTDPMLNVVFVDNHDLTRFFSSVNEDFGRFKLGLAFILTTRGIPQIYYGTEILKAGYGHDSNYRKGFPGGWEEDPIDAFTAEGRQALGRERELPVTEAHEFVTTLSIWRMDKEVIHSGQLTHFIPENNVYVYFRHNEEETVMVIMNGSEEEQTIHTQRFIELMDGYTSGLDIISGQTITSLGQITVGGLQPMVIELK